MEDNQITDNDKEDDKQDRIELVQRAVEGDKEAFTNLYTLTYSEVYHIVKVFIHNEDTAQDIVQETYYKSLRKIKQLKEPDKFPVWIKKIAVNTAKAHLRKVDWVLFSEADGEGGKSIAELQDERLEHIPEIVVDQAETKKLIDQILGELDEKQRMVVGMFYYEQMSVNEIAEALNCSVNTVKSRLNYARKKIGKEIAELEKKGGSDVSYGKLQSSVHLRVFRFFHSRSRYIPSGSLSAMLPHGEALPESRSHPVSLR